MAYFRTLGRIVLWGLFIASHSLYAQSPGDGLLMNKRQMCTMLQYNQSSWQSYWEGDLKRTNDNIGTITNQSVMLMSVYGITDRLNFMFALPWVRTSSDVSYLEGQSGIQDISVWIKWQPWQFRAGGGTFKFQTTGGLSSPASGYFVDFLPLSLGLRSKTASLRGIVHFAADKGFYGTFQAGHTWRSDVKLDRDAYLFHNEIIYSDHAPAPNWFDATLRVGFLNKRWQTEIWGESATGLSGDDIRYNSAPQITNKMQYRAAGAFVKYWLNKQWALQAGGSYVLDGRNIGQSTAFNGAVFYLIEWSKSK